MKRFSIFILIIMMVAPNLPIYAQTAFDGSIFSLSGRYSVPIPKGWYATTVPQFFEVQGFLPGESITMADSQETLDSLDTDVLLEEYNGAEVDGAVMLSIVFPAEVIANFNLDNEEYGTIVAGTLGFNAADRNAITLNGVDGFWMERTYGDYQTWFLVLLDENGHAFLTAAFNHIDYGEQVEAMLMGIKYRTFSRDDLASPNNLPISIDIVPEIARVNIPNGWWIVILDDGGLIATPIFDFEFMVGLESGDFSDPQSIFLMGMPLDLPLLEANLYTSNGQVNQDTIDELIPQLNFFSDSSMRVLNARPWENPNGIQGISLETILPQYEGISMDFIILPTPRGAYVVAAIIPEVVRDTFSASINEAFNSISIIVTE